MNENASAVTENAASVQDAATVTATEVQSVADGAAAPAAPRQQGGFGMLVPMLLILAIFYFMMIRPQQRKEKERRQMIDELRAGARIIFAGGIVGTIREATEKTFKVETDAGCTMEILRSCVNGTVADEGAKA